MSNASLFKIQKINQENGFIEVRFINFLGPIFTGKKTLDDFKTTVQIGTGSFTSEGQEITEAREIYINDNPNEDLVYSIDIPLDTNGQYLNVDDLLQHIARHYPREQFVRNEKTKLAIHRNDINDLLDQTFEIEFIHTNAQSIIVNDDTDRLEKIVI